MSKFTSVMSAIGNGMKKMLGFGVPILAMAAGILPGNLGGEAAAIVGIISSVEKVFTNIGQATGSGVQKLQAALPDVMNVIRSSQLVSGHKIVDTDKFQQGCVSIINGYVSIMNSLEFNSGLEQKQLASVNPQLVATEDWGTGQLVGVDPTHIPSAATPAPAAPIDSPSGLGGLATTKG